MKHEALRDSLIQQAETSFVVLSTQIDHLLDLVGFYLERYPSNGDAGRRLKDRELKTTVDNIASLTSQLAEVIARWKAGGDRILSRTGTELNILNEIWANGNALIYFLASHDIDLEPFNSIKATSAYHALVKCNRLLA